MLQLRLLPEETELDVERPNGGILLQRFGEEDGAIQSTANENSDWTRSIGGSGSTRHRHYCMHFFHRREPRERGEKTELIFLIIDACFSLFFSALSAFSAVRNLA